MAEVDFAVDKVTSLMDTDDYYEFVTKGFNGGDLAFHENMYGSASTASTGDVFIAGTFLITVSIDLVSYPSVFATSSSTPAEFSSSGQSVSYHQYESAGIWQVYMNIESYYTGATAPWEAFDGKWDSSATVQEPSFTYQTHVAKAMVHSAPWWGTLRGVSRAPDLTKRIQNLRSKVGEWRKRSKLCTDCTATSILLKLRPSLPCTPRRPTRTTPPTGGSLTMRTTSGQ